MLPKGADILIQVHYHKTGKAETDATAVGLYLSKKPLPRQVHTGFVFPNLSMKQALAARAKVEEAKKAGKNIGILELLRDVDAMVIPAGSTHYEVKASTKPGASMMARPLDRDILAHFGDAPHALAGQGLYLRRPSCPTARRESR